MVPERPLEPEVWGLVLEAPGQSLAQTSGLSEGRAARTHLPPHSARGFFSLALMAVSLVQGTF